MEAIILAGGFGTRLREVVSDVPKSMAPVNGRPFLEYLLNYLTGQKIARVILSVGYRQDQIRNHFKDHYKSLEIVYAVEEEPLGTGGGIVNALSKAETDTVFALNGDSMFRIDLGAMKMLHNSSSAALTLALRYLDDTSRFGTVRIDGERRVTGFMEKDPDGGSGYINGGIYLIDKRFFLSHAPGNKFSVEHDGFEKWYPESKIMGYPAKGYFIDIGIPEDYMIAQDEFRRFED